MEEGARKDQPVVLIAVGAVAAVFSFLLGAMVAVYATVG